MQIAAILRTGATHSRVRFADGTVEVIPNTYAAVGKEYLSVKMLKNAIPSMQYEGEHITARLEKMNAVTIRNKDNICSQTIARNQRRWGAAKVWCLFLMEVSKETSFAAAVDYFERHGIAMRVSG
ncbi:MAG: hypothetical protein LBD29_06195 [Treponema sp.]|jgi:hypothetical protein|nr:hypothetical protein [Treponema sp.]